MPPGSIGCHEIDLVERRDAMVLAGCARQVSDQIDLRTGGQVPGAVKLVDATDPRHPTTVASWELPVDPLAGVGCFDVNFAHSIRFEEHGSEAYVSYWDAGTIRLDLSVPAAPAVISSTVIAPRRGR